MSNTSEVSRERVLELPITRVVAFEDRAEVVREATVELGGGAQRLRVRGLSPLVSDGRLSASVELEGDEEAFIDDVRVEHRWIRDERPDEERLRSLRAEVEARDDEANTRRRELERLRERRASLEIALGRYADEVGRGLLRDAGDRPAWERALEGFEAALCSLDDELRDARERYACAQREADRARGLAAQRDVVPQRYVADVVIAVSGAPGTAKLRLSTVLPCALWRPAHEARLERGKGGEAKVRWSTYATVWQKTGEPWNDVELVLSTARPSAGARLPDLAPDRLSLRDKTPEEKRHIFVEHRDEAVPKADLAGAAPGVYDGGEPRRFAPAGRVTLPSDGRPHRVATGEFESEARLENVALPELASQVFLRATLRNTSNQPLLAGPVTLLSEGAYVGVGDLPYVGAGEDFDLSFGSDDRFRVRMRRRRVEEERTLAKNRTHFVTEVDLSYTGDVEEQVLVLLRLPKSELKQLKVVPSEAHCSEGAPAPDEHGLVRLPLRLSAGQARELSLGFWFDASSDVVLPDPW